MLFCIHKGSICALEQINLGAWKMDFSGDHRCEVYCIGENSLAHPSADTCFLSAVTRQPWPAVSASLGFHFILSSLLQPQLFSSPQQSLCPWELASLDYSVCGPVSFPSGNHTGQGCSSATHCVPWANGLTFHAVFCLQSRGNSCVCHSVDVKSLHHLKIFRASTTCWPCSRTGEDLALVNARGW